VLNKGSQAEVANFRANPLGYAGRGYTGLAPAWCSAQRVAISKPVIVFQFNQWAVLKVAVFIFDGHFGVFPLVFVTAFSC
jgi:hypothetical protein